MSAKEFICKTLAVKIYSTKILTFLKYTYSPRNDNILFSYRKKKFTLQTSPFISQNISINYFFDYYSFCIFYDSDKLLR